jgi:hypothetical protein
MIRTTRLAVALAAIAFSATPAVASAASTPAATSSQSSIIAVL